MAIAESANAPANIQATSNVATTASFTPDAGSLVVALVGLGNTTGSGLTTGTVTDSVSSTWVRLGRANVSGSGCSEVWVTDAGSSPAARTVTCTGTATTGAGIALAVKTLTGAAAAAAQTGAVATSLGTATSLSITTTVAGSHVYGAIAHSEATVTLVANGITTIINNFADSSNGSCYADIKATSDTGTPGATVLGLTTATSSNYLITLVEILAGSYVAPTVIDHLGAAIQAAKPFVWTTGDSLSAFSSWSGTYITDPSAETLTGWAATTNCTIALSAAQALDGTNSCAVTATAAGQVVMRTPISPFNRGTGQYHHMDIAIRSATAGRLARARIRYYNASSTLVSSSAYSADVTTSTTGWTTAFLDNATVNDVTITKAAIEVTIDGSAISEVHYVDVANLGNGKNAVGFEAVLPDVSMPVINGPARGQTHMTMITIHRQYRAYDSGGDVALLATDDLTWEQVFSTTENGFNFFGGPYEHLLWQNVGYVWNGYCSIVPANGLAGDTTGKVTWGNTSVGGDRGRITPDPIVTDGQIHHLMVTSVGSTNLTFVWLDGVRYGPITTYRGDTYSGQNAFFSASGSFGWTGFNGYLGHHAQYKRILSDDEIREHAALALMPDYATNRALIRADHSYVPLAQAKVFDGSVWNTSYGVRVFNGTEWV